MRIIYSVVIAFVLGFLIVYFNHKISPKKPSVRPATLMNYGAWLPWWDEERALQSQKIAGSKLSAISPVWYIVDSQGILKETGTKKKNEIKKIALDNQTKLLPTISNDAGNGFDPEGLEKIFDDKNIRDTLISELVDLAKANGYAGWDLDFERVPDNRSEEFSSFVSKLAEILHENKLEFAVTVAAKSTDGGAQDWFELGKYADEIRIMVYDFHNSQSEAGAITPLNEIRKVGRYALKNIPEEKIVIGLPLYGYHWNNEDVTPLEYEDVIGLIKQKDIVPNRDSKSKEMTASVDGGFLWYQDVESVTAKINEVENMGIHNVFFWRLGGEDTSLWGNI